MRRNVRTIAILLVAAMLATVAAVVVTAGGSDNGAPGSSSTPDSLQPSVAPVDGTTTIPRGPHVTLVFCSDIDCPRPSADVEEAILATLDADPRVASYEYVSPERAYALFLEQFGDDEELAGSVDEDAVPARVEVDVLTVDAIAGLLADYANQDGVAEVVDELRAR